MAYDRGKLVTSFPFDFPFDFEPNRIPFSAKPNVKL